MQKSVLRVPLGQGVQTKTDPKAVAPTALLSAQNCVFDQAGALGKRNGNTVLSNGAVGTKGFNSVGLLNNQLHALGNDNVMYNFATQGQAPVAQGTGANTLVPVTVSTLPIASSTTADYVLSDVAVSSSDGTNGIKVFVFESTSGGCYYQVNDLVSDATLVPFRLLGSLAFNPILITAGPSILLFAESLGQLYAYQFSANAPTAVPTQTSVGPTLDQTNISYCVGFDGTLIWVFYKVFGSTTAFFYTLNPFTLAQVNAPATVAGGSLDPLLSPASMACVWTGTYMYFFSAGSSSAGFYRVNVAQYASPTSFLGFSKSISVAGTAPGPISAGYGAAGTYALFEVTDTATFLQSYTVSGSTITAGSAVRGLTLVSQYNTNGLAIVSHQSPQQATYFLIDNTLRIQGKFLSGSAGYTPSRIRNRVASFSTYSLGGVRGYRAIAAVSVQSQVTAVNGAIVTRNGTQQIVLTVQGPSPLQPVALGSDLHWPGGQLWADDGVTLAELGFHLYPEGVTVDAPSFNIQQSQPAVGVAGTNVYTVTCPPASQIANGSYLCLQDGIVLLFGINGATPSLDFSLSAGNYTLPVALLSTDTAATVTKKCYQAIYNVGINSVYNSLALNQAQNQFTFSLNVSSGLTTLIDPGHASQTFDAFQYTPGTSSTKQVISIQCPAARYLAAGQYFYIQSNGLLASAFTTIAVWFRIGGVGSAPAAVGVNGGTLQVTLTGSETSAGVATAIVAAISAATGSQSVFTAAVSTGLTNIALLTDKTNGAGASGVYNFNAGGSLARIAGSTTSGPYVYAFVYRWVDTANQVHQSAPSPLVNVSIGAQQISSNSIACGSATFQIPCCRATDKTGVTIEVYRSLSGGTTLYRVTNSSSPLLSSLTADTVTFHDTVSDDALVGSDLLYTLGMLPNFSPPSASMVVSHQSRLFLAGLDNPNQIQPSQKVQAGQGLAFNPGLAITLDPSGGPIQALAAMDDKVVAFKRAQIWAFNGDGPDPLGGSQQFSAPTLITSETGCLGPSQIVSMPLGLMYVSEKGIYLLNRNLQASYIGAPVEAYVLGGPIITCAISVEAQNQVRFYTNSGNTLVYDYYAGQWTVFTAQSGNAAATWLGAAVYCDSLLKNINLETPGTWQDGTVPFLYQFETAWIDGGIRQAIQRVYKILALCNVQPGQSITFQIYYDYDVNYYDTVTWTPAAQGDGNSYGGALYGVTPYGGYTSSAQPIVQVRVNPPRHRCQVIKIKCSEAVPANLPLSFTELAFEVGGLSGLSRQGGPNVAG